MAPLSSLHSQFLRPHISQPLTPISPHPHTVLKKTQNQDVVCSKNSPPDEQNLCFSIEVKPQKIQRRDVLLYTTFAALPFPAIVPLAYAEDVPENFRIYSDDVNKFKIMIPQDWQIGEGQGNGFKSVTAFYPNETSNSNVSIVITGLGADFTRLESFGKVDAFAENLVSGLDRSWQKPPGVSAKLIDSQAKNGLYYIEYSLQNPGESQRHLFSVLGIANNGWYNRLYTLTGQFIEEEADKYGPEVLKAVASFRLQ